MALSAAEQVLVDAIPENAEIDYTDLHNNLTTAKQKQAIRAFRAANRDGKIQTRTAWVGDELKLFVSRVGFALPAQEGGA